tara:strand:+ start:318 stop:1049 length:732 start_codon:yes stop_codon:yes gene_type:complete
MLSKEEREIFMPLMDADGHEVVSSTTLFDQFLQWLAQHPDKKPRQALMYKWNGPLSHVPRANGAASRALNRIITYPRVIDYVVALRDGSIEPYELWEWRIMHKVQATIEDIMETAEDARDRLNAARLIYERHRPRAERRSGNIAITEDTRPALEGLRELGKGLGDAIAERVAASVVSEGPEPGDPTRPVVSIEASGVREGQRGTDDAPRSEPPALPAGTEPLARRDEPRTIPRHRRRRAKRKE